MSARGRGCVKTPRETRCRQRQPRRTRCSDLFVVGRGFGIPENGPESSFYTASVDSSLSLIQKADAHQSIARPSFPPLWERCIPISVTPELRARHSSGGGIAPVRSMINPYACGWRCLAKLKVVFLYDDVRSRSQRAIASSSPSVERAATISPEGASASIARPPRNS